MSFSLISNKTVLILWLIFLISVSFKGKTQALVNQEDSLEWISNDDRVRKDMAIGHYDNALILAKSNLIFAEKIFGNQHDCFATSANNLAVLYDYFNSNDLAEYYYKEATSIRKKLSGESDIVYLKNLKNLASFYNKINNYDATVFYYKELLRIKQFLLGENSLDYAEILNYLALFYDKNEKYILSEPLHLQTLNIRKQVLGENDSLYTQSLSNLGFFYNDINNFKLAETTFKKVLEIRKQTLGDRHISYIESLCNLAVFYSGTNQFSLSKSTFDLAIKIQRNLDKIDKLLYATTLNNYANLCAEMGDYKLAEQLYNETLSIRKSIQIYGHKDYTSTLSNLANLHIENGNYFDAFILLNEAIKIEETTLGKNNVGYYITLNSLALSHFKMGNINLSRTLFLEILYKYETTFNKNTYNYALFLINFASLCTYELNYDDAESKLKEALSVVEKIYGQKNILYVNSLGHLASLYKLNGNAEVAVTINQQILVLQSQLIGKEHRNYALTLNNLAGAYRSLGRKDLAEKLLIESIEIFKMNFGSNHPMYATLLNNLLNNYYENGDIAKCEKIIAEAISTQIKNENLLLMKFSEAEKEIFLAKNDYMEDAYLSILYKFKYEKTDDFYQLINSKRSSLLLGKTQLAYFANTSEKSDVKLLRKQWQESNHLLDKLIQLSSKQRELKRINLDSLKLKNQDLEKELISRFTDLGSKTYLNPFTCKQVSSNLKKNEVVIQWTSFAYFNPIEKTDSVIYATFIIRHLDTIPKFITLFEEKQLKQLLTGYHGNGERGVELNGGVGANNDIGLYNLIWKPLLPYLANVKTVYNLPSGLLHKISFASLTDSTSGKQLFDNYELHQLLSIEELINPFVFKNSIKTINLFGGANYDEVNSQTNTSSSIIAPLYRNATGQKNIKFNYLSGTEKEIKVIAENVKNTSWAQQTYNGSKATEDNLKQISGETSPTILHIATHGFYFPPDPAILTNLAEDNKNVAKDFPLLRSGLVLSGVNNYWGKDAVDGKEDGIVTAQEISNMNLINTDLVTLSACETALGDIKGSEGVYGLQRAFKMAGVKNLLMSLWSVPDKETGELMSLFYGEVFKGESYYNAFRKAQLTLKLKYTDPTKWAGFVLVGQ